MMGMISDEKATPRTKREINKKYGIKAMSSVRDMDKPLSEQEARSYEMFVKSVAEDTDRILKARR